MGHINFYLDKSNNQYKEYCKLLEQLVFSDSKDRNTKDEIALLTLLIEKWDANTFHLLN